VSDYSTILHQVPDVALAIGLIALFGLGWGLVRTVLTIRLLRRAAA